MKKPFYKKWWFIAIAVLLILAVIGNELDDSDEVIPVTVMDTEDNTETEASEGNAGEWKAKIDELAKNDDVAADKFYELENIMIDYEATSDEVNEFKSTILAAYQDKSYLNNPTDHQKMLNFIFQSYMVEQNETNEWKDFAFDFHQNVKYVYRGADTPDSEAVKANEAQMDKVIGEL